MYTWLEFKSTEGFDLFEVLQWKGVGVDPYMVWAFSTDFQFLKQEGSKEQLPVLIELKEEFNAADVDKADLVRRLLANSDYIPFFEWMPRTQYIVARVPRSDFISRLSQEEFAQCIERFEIGLSAQVNDRIQVLSQELTSFRIDGDTDHSYSIDPDTESPPIVGLIDDGVAFLNQRFQTRSGTTRIQYFWDQNHSDEHPIGRIYSHDIIDELIGECYEGSESYALMEEIIYRREGMSDLIRAVSHGTHILDTAAGGNAMNIETSQQQELLVVKLPKVERRFSDTSGIWLKVSVVEALQFLLSSANVVAGRQGKSRDLVVNLSYGNLAGPHDGSSILERAMDYLIESGADLPFVNEVSVHVASGNQRQARCYAELNIESNFPQVLRWRILPDDATPSFLELWIEDTVDLSDLEITVKPPVDASLIQGAERFVVGKGECRVLEDNNTGFAVCSYVSLPKGINANGDRPMVLIAVSPTNTNTNANKKSNARAPAGVWSVEIHNNNTNRNCQINAWIQRDENTFGDPIRGRQSYFDDPDYKRTDAMGYPVGPEVTQAGYVQLHDTVNGIATGKLTKTIGAYRYSGRTRVDYAGLPKDNGKASSKIHVDAVSEDSMTCEGIIGAGTRSGSRVALNGTSVATAHATRLRYDGSQVRVPSPSPTSSLPANADSRTRRVQRKR